ncbi:MAG: hypothetical protein IT463_10070 [Planctomycetes bacterium]|nr:hypothetical protein [Planctomycetota bacterium]
MFIPLGLPGLAPQDYYAARVSNTDGDCLPCRVVRHQGEPGLLVWPGRPGPIGLAVEAGLMRFTFSADAQGDTLAIARR